MNKTLRLDITEKIKDRKPATTVKIIKKLLEGLGITTEETGWNSTLRNTYSLRLVVKGTDIGTNGKGTSKDFARASAYAEFMERMQNRMLYELHFAHDTDRLLKFRYAPDERLLSADELRQNNIRVYKKFHSLGFFDNIYSHHTPLPTVPFFSINKKGLTYIPIQLLRRAYGSHGMCAGNTPHEALVQGMSEIFERYVLFQILYNRITPPTIPSKHLKKYPFIEDLLKQIRKSGPYETILKDCSLDIGYPVVCLIIIDHALNKYGVKFASHPFFQIAAERCVTEIFQGRSFAKFRSAMKSLSHTDDEIFGTDNQFSITTTGDGLYPMELFSKDESYPFREFTYHGTKDNAAICNHLIKQMISSKNEVLIRNNSFAGFPAFHILIPGMSEVYPVDDNTLHSGGDDLRLNSNHDILERLFDNIWSSPTELKKVLSAIDDIVRVNSMSLAAFFRLPLNAGSRFSSFHVGFLKCLIQYRLKDYSSAYETINDLVGNVSDSNESDIPALYRCVRDFILKRICAKSAKDIAPFLEHFYDAHVVSAAVSSLKKPVDFLAFYHGVPCWHCTRCRSSDYCHYKDIRNIHIRLKDAFVANCPDQQDISRLVALDQH